jgi:hypothetical protein
MKKLVILIMICGFMLATAYEHKLMFVTNTLYQFENKEVDFGVGANYLFKMPDFSEKVSIGFNPEVYFLDNMNYMGHITFNLEPVNNFMLTVAPGVNYIQYKEPKLDFDKTPINNEIIFNLRFAASYNYDIDKQYYLQARVVSDLYKEFASVGGGILLGIKF